MSALDSEIAARYTDENRTVVIGLAGACVFVMQLGFLLFEVGLVDPVWTRSIIIKNMEDTWVGVLAFISFGWTISAGGDSLGGFMGDFKASFLLNTPASSHEEVFLAAMFATTTATIMSGCILQRMKNRGYICWCLLIVSFNYSIIAHWVWHPDGWLSKLGYIDCAGSSVVHMTGGCCGLMAVYFLGPRNDAMDSDTGRLKPVPPSQRPIILAMGVLILWFGWFAFNISSPIAADLDIGGRLGSVALNTCVAPAAASFGSYLIMTFFYEEKISFEDLCSAALAGCVAVTAGAMTMGVLQAFATGFTSAAVYYLAGDLERKFLLDDPLGVGPVHLWCGVWGMFCEGFFADHTVHRRGLVHGGYQHFFVQLLGIISILSFNVVMSTILWYFMDNVIFWNTELRVTTLDTYLGTKLFEANQSAAFAALLECKTFNTRKLLFDFHRFCELSYVEEQLNFTLAVREFHTLCSELLLSDPPIYSEAAISARSNGDLMLKDANSSSRSKSDRRQTLAKLKRQRTRTGSITWVQKVRDSLGSTANSTTVPSTAYFNHTALMDTAGIKANCDSILRGFPTKTTASLQELMVHECVESILKEYIYHSAPQCLNLPHFLREEAINMHTKCQAMGRLLTDALFFDRIQTEVDRMISVAFYKFFTVINPDTDIDEAAKLVQSLPGVPKKRVKKSTGGASVDMVSSEADLMGFSMKVPQNLYGKAQIPYVINRKWQVLWEEELLSPNRGKRMSMGQIKSLLTISSAGSKESHPAANVGNGRGSDIISRLSLEAAEDPRKAIIISKRERVGPFAFDAICEAAGLSDDEDQSEDADQMPDFRTDQEAATTVQLSPLSDLSADLQS